MGHRLQVQFHTAVALVFVVAVERESAVASAAADSCAGLIAVENTLVPSKKPYLKETLAAFVAFVTFVGVDRLDVNSEC